MRALSRRRVLLGMGGLLAAACGSAPETVPEPTPPAPTPTPTTTTPPQPADAGPADASKPDAKEPQISPEELLSTVDAIVVLMMENRSFDHFLGALKSDATYVNKATVEGLSGTESNATASGVNVPVFKMDNFTPEDPPHSFEAVHAQWNNGKNDGFVKEHAGRSEREVMGFHDRSQIPFYYWLADNFTVCDNWFASVLGPTWPNRYYLHAATSDGKKGNTPFVTGGPDTIWEKLRSAGKSYKNYTASVVAWYTGGFVGKLLSLNPVKQMSEFFADCRNGTLPNFSIIDPDFTSNDDHPSHDIRQGQAFVASVYKALAESPQWKRVLFVITYDEHGGFFDHVPPPKTVDQLAEFQQLGIRVPAFVIGPTVRRGHVEKGVLEHVSVLSTVKTRFGVTPLNQRMAQTRDLSSCIDPAFYKNPQPPPPNPPKVTVGRVPTGIGVSSQPDLERMVADGTIPDWAIVDRRSAKVRYQAFLDEAVRVGAVRVE
ncbi:MAG: alkaline phosphatase family protein [Myxococcales bacterium]|nr:alkaline phosphatase family protein [Myxococcales bacterium]